MIKLLLAIKKRGVDIDKIYTIDVLNEDDDEDMDMDKVVPCNLRVKNSQEP